MRAFLFAANRALIGELSPSDILEMTRVEEINGEHSLTVRTLAVLSKGQRLLVKDDDGRFREWVVTGEDTSHAAGDSAIGTYECVWSLQYDFSGFVVKTMPGTVSPVSVTEALTAAFPSGHGWQVGTVTRQATGGASFWYKSSWEALSTLLSVWGGEIDAEISVTGGVITRRVCVYDAIGEQTPHRRFDYGHDMPTIRRTVAEDLMTCRIIPRGKGEETESGGYGRKIGIEDVNGGIEWLQNDQAARLLAYTVDGVTRYPTQVVENPDMETPEQLLEWARSVLDSYTTPHVAYEADVTQFARTGLDAHGIGLGDAVQCVDREFLSEGLRVQGRVMRMEVNELDPTDMTLTIGNLTDSIADYIRGLQVQLSAFGDRSESWEAAANVDSAWLRALVANLNAAYNQAGTYHFSSFEKGEIWSSVPLDDEGRPTQPGGWAMNINGMGFRLASGVTTSGDWDWRAFGNGRGFTADEVNTGIIRGGNSYWNLTTGDFHLSGRVGYQQANITITGARTSRWYNLWKETTARFTGDGMLLQATAPLQQDGSSADTTDYTANYFSAEVGTLTEDYNSISDDDYSAGTDTLVFIGDKNSSNVRFTVMGTNYLVDRGKQDVDMKVTGFFGLTLDTSERRIALGTRCARIGVPASHSSANNSVVTIAGDPLVLSGYAGTTSDRRFKEHIAYVGDEADEFVRALRPVTFVKDARTQAGFYAQDVEEAVRQSGWEPDPVSSVDMGDDDGERLILDYEGLIAPLVAYCQHLEARIETLENA
jgi:phage minor structural protein